MPPTDPHRSAPTSPTWWILAGLEATAEWTPAEARWARREQKKVRSLVPRRRGMRLDGIVIDWQERADVQLLRAIQAGDHIVTVTKHGRRGRFVEPACTLVSKSTFWRPSMRRTSMLTVACAAADVVCPLPDLLHALKREKVSLRRGGLVSYAITAPATIAVLERILSVDGVKALGR